MKNTPIYCTSCNFTSVLVHRPVRLIYQLPNGEKLQTGRDFCWCNKCCGIRDAEPDFSKYFDTEQRISELTEKTKSVKFKAYRAIGKLLGGPPTEYDEQELIELTIGLKIARARGNAPNCLICGSEDIQSLDKYLHPCGGHLVQGEPHEDDPRFAYASEIIYLDYEGRRTRELDLAGNYTHFAQHANIECVLNDGIFSLIYVDTLFDEDVFKTMLIDLAIFRKFAKIIELRIMHGDFYNPLDRFTEGPTQRQKDSIPEAPRALITRNQKPVSKWLRSQIMGKQPS